ncbi:hypothetical protein BDV96DRAFT_644573 [Lophiotrema nucula]|uniref:Uncharacterized protein n=1 Tax=Lophiotrema nucula TaxID=690887 RepID=A0A6A5ZC81_9PLEO|nr:hypothetical protein BDV96DRAFT_644573 [Lophiotrema nucula]
MPNQLDHDHPAGRKTALLIDQKPEAITRLAYEVEEMRDQLNPQSRELEDEEPDLQAFRDEIISRLPRELRNAIYDELLEPHRSQPVSITYELMQGYVFVLPQTQNKHIKDLRELAYTISYWSKVPYFLREEYVGIEFLTEIMEQFYHTYNFKLIYVRHLGHLLEGDLLRCKYNPVHHLRRLEVTICPEPRWNSENRRLHTKQDFQKDLEAFSLLRSLRSLKGFRLRLVFRGVEVIIRKFQEVLLLIVHELKEKRSLIALGIQLEARSGDTDDRLNKMRCELQPAFDRSVEDWQLEIQTNSIFERN